MHMALTLNWMITFQLNVLYKRHINYHIKQYFKLQLQEIFLFLKVLCIQP